MQTRRAGRVTLALAVLVAILGLAGGATAADNTIRLDPATSQVADGATFNIKVIENATVATSGVSATVTFDKGILQVTSVTRGSAFATAPLFVAGDAAAIAAANKSGKLQNVAAAFFPPTSVPAGEQEFITVGFKAIACGTVKMTVPTGRVDATMLDGRAATYGANLKVTTTGATVTVCAAGAAASAPAGASPGASLDPAASGSPGASESIDPNASPSAAVAGGALQPGASVPPSAAPAIDSALVGSTSEQSGWLNFATAALALAAAGLAALILVLTLIAIGAAIVGAIVVIRVWRRYAERDAKEASVASVATVDATPSPGLVTDGSPPDPPAPAGIPTGSAMPIPNRQP